MKGIKNKAMETNLQIRIEAALLSITGALLTVIYVLFANF